MAEIGKFSAHSVGRLLLHNNRSPDDGVTHSNIDIDINRTHLNYHLKKGGSRELTERLKEVFCCGRKDQIVLAEVVVTLPKDVRAYDEYKFFKAVYNFYKKDFGSKNIINAVVHKDEETPHMHLDFAPVVKGDISYDASRGYGKKIQRCLDEWKRTHPGELERLACKQLISQAYLREMHTRLSDFVEQELGYKVSILNGATENGNKTVSTMKLERLQAEVERLEQQRKFLAEDVYRIKQMSEQTGVNVENIDLLSLLQTISELRIQNQMLQNVIRRNGCQYNADEITMVNDTKLLSKSSNLNVIDGSLAWADIEEEGIVVTETYNVIPRPQPYAKMLASNPEYQEALEEAHRYNGRVYKKKLKDKNKTIILIKADNETQTFEALLELERILQESAMASKKVYMSRLEYDRYDNGRNVLARGVSEALYFIGQDSRRATDEKEREKSK